MLSAATSLREPLDDPLADALARKAATRVAGAAETRPLAAGDGWRVVDIVCTAGPHDRPFEERQVAATISLVVSGTFVYRSERGTSLLSPGSFLLGEVGQRYECSHQHGEGDRCLSFQFDPEVYERVAHDAGATPAAFARDRLPPLRGLAAISARARAATAGDDAFEEVAIALAGTVARTVGEAASSASERAPDPGRIARVLRRLEARTAEPCRLDDLARDAGMSRFHFLRTFTRVTGVTPHQWILRARLREAAARLTSTKAPVTEIALDVGFDDLSNFIRTFRAEFGVSPRAHRARG